MSRNSLPLMSAAERRAKRLEHYFRPYSHIKLELDAALRRALEVKTPRRKRNGQFQSGSFYVRVFSPLLHAKAPDWLEARILRNVLEFCRSFRREVIGGGETAQFVLDEEIRRVYAELRAERQAEISTAQQIFPETLPNKMSQQDLLALWKTIRAQYFPDRADIDEYELAWSTRKQTRSLASCNPERRRVQVASEMNQAECFPHLEPLLYHEMCHAVLGVPEAVNGRRMYHGREFRALERLHPRIAEMDLWIKNGGWHAAVVKSRRRRR